MTELEREEKKNQFVDYFEDIPVIKYAAYYVGIDEKTAYNWIKDDEGFSSRINQAKARWARKRGLKTKAEFQLERLDKEIWREQKDIVTDGEPIKPALVVFMEEEDGPDNSKDSE